MSALLQSLIAWRLKTPFFYGWLVLAICFLATLTATGVSQVTLGGIQVYITEDTGWNKSTMALAITIGTWCSGFLAPVVGRLADRFGPRWLMPLGLLVAVSAFFALAGAHAIWQFYMAYIIGRAVSNPVLIGVVPRTAAVNFFRRRRNIVLAMVTSYRPIGAAINIQIISLVASHRGWRAAYQYLGYFGLLLILPVALFVRRRPEDIGLLPDGVKQQEPASIGSAGQAGSLVQGVPRDTEFSWTVGEAIHTKAFWLIVMTAVCGTLASASVTFSMVPYLTEEVGISKGQASAVLSLGVFLAITNLGWGYLSELITPRRCLVVGMAVSGAMVLYLLSVGSVTMAMAFALGFGVFSGPATPLENMILAQYYGRTSFGAIAGLYTPFQTVMLGFGPTFASLLIEQVGSYEILYLTTACLYFAASLFVFLARHPALPARGLAERPA